MYDDYTQPIFFFPDPVYEFHPEHRKWGQVGERFLRALKHTVVFYTINMMPPYIHEIKDPGDKQKNLNEIYFYKKTLWEYDHKYFLFEGYNQWIIDWDRGTNNE